MGGEECVDKSQLTMKIDPDCRGDIIQVFYSTYSMFAKNDSFVLVLAMSTAANVSACVCDEATFMTFMNSEVSKLGRFIHRIMFDDGDGDGDDRPIVFKMYLLDYKNNSIYDCEFMLNNGELTKRDRAILNEYKRINYEKLKFSYRFNAYVDGEKRLTFKNYRQAFPQEHYKLYKTLKPLIKQKNEEHMRSIM
jgi:hypothetical protein